MPCHGRVQYHEPGRSHAQILIDAGGVPGRRIDPDYQWMEVALENARDPGAAPSFADDGLCFVAAPACPVDPASFASQRAGYEAALIETLERELGAAEAVVFDHTIRAEDEGYRPPSYHVHCDYNANSAAQRLTDELGESRAALWQRGPFAVVNMWRPLAHPVQRAPLAFVRPSSVVASDWVDVDIVFPHRRGQIRGLAWSPAHRWVFLDRMQPDELAVFTVYANEGVAAVPHAAVQLGNAPENAPPRRSIESRLFVRFDRSGARE